MKKKIILALVISLITSAILSQTLFIQSTPILNSYLAKDILYYITSLFSGISSNFGKKSLAPSAPVSSFTVEPEIAAVHSGGQPARPKVLDALVSAADQQELLIHMVPENKRKDIYLDQGFAYQAAGMKDKAAAKYNEAIQKDPQDAISYVRLASVYIEKKDTGQAINLYEKAMQIQPDNDAAALELASVYQYTTRELDKAITVYSQLIAKKPNDPYLKLLLANTLIDAGRKDEAKNVLLQIVNSDPTNETARNRLNTLGK